MWFQEPGNIDFENFENNELTELRFCGVLFGVTSRPFLLFPTIIHHMNKYSTIDKELLDRFLSSPHVDDLITGANNVDDAFDYFRKRKDRMEVGSFNLRTFRSNSVDLEQWVNRNYGMLTEEHNCLIKNNILGLKWDKFEDNFAFDFNENSVEGPTWLTFDFVGFEKMKRIIKIIVVIRIKFTHILINSHKILIKDQ